MIGPSEKPVTRKYADHSTMEAFAFRFFCDRCGREWRSAPYDFNLGSFAAPKKPAVYQILWSDQHRAAYERAKRDASFAFNRCPICGRSVCDACFYLAKSGVSDLCKDCLKKMVQEAQAVNSRLIAFRPARPSRGRPGGLARASKKE